jgi:ribosomal protein S18 acetylase RimI-like enzyme
MAVHDAYNDATRSARRTTPVRLPRPSTRTRVRKEIVLRLATPADAAPCVLVDSSYTTTHIWQLDTRQDTDEIRVSFRQIRLPRELTLISPHRPPSVPAGAANAQRRGQIWLVAEEVEVHSDAVSEGRPVAVQSAPWSHTVRRSGSVSSVQLSLPPAMGATSRPDTTRASDSPRRSDNSRIVGYAVATAAREQSAYLSALIVDREFRRQGIGGRLLGEIKRWAAHQGADRVIADAQARNHPALRLLQKAGFSFCGFNDCCYGDQEVAVFFAARLR